MAVNPDKYVRKIVSIPVDIWEQIEDYRFQHRFKTESAAIRDLIARGLQSQSDGSRSKATDRDRQTKARRQESQ